jgi:hypothetical protein
VTAVRHALRAVAPLSVAAFLAGLGLPAIGIAAAVIVVMIAVACWVLSDEDRTVRLARISLGIRGNARCLDRAEPGAALPDPAQEAPEPVKNLPGTVTTQEARRGGRVKG